MKVKIYIDNFLPGLVNQEVVGLSPVVYRIENCFNAIKEKGKNKGIQMRQTAKKIF